MTSTNGNISSFVSIKPFSGLTLTEAKVLYESLCRSYKEEMNPAQSGTLKTLIIMCAKQYEFILPWVK